MIRQHDGPWNTWLCQDLDGILEAWDSCSLSELTTGVLHIGFQPLDAADLEGIATRFGGDLLLTESARYGLPEAFTTSIVAVGSASGMPLHRVESGWGVQKTLARQQTSPPRYQRPEPNDTDSWLARVSMEDQALGRALERVGIHDDRTYYAREWCLRTEFRRKLGTFRAIELGVSRPPDPCMMAKAAPPWLIDRAIDSLNLRVRSARVFKRMRLKTIRELAELTRELLLVQRNFGETSCRDVVNSLRAGIEAGPADLESISRADRPISNVEHKRDIAISDPGLMSSIWQSFQNLAIRDAKILAPRLGLLARPETLQEIATTLGLTRERVRQMENEALKHFLSDADWLKKIDNMVKDLSGKQMSPLSLFHAQELDQWFDGVSEYSTVIERILRKSKTSGTYIIEIEGTQYFASISQAEWNSISNRCEGIIRQSKTRDNPREYALEMISRLLPESALVFSVILREKLDKQLRPEAVS